MSVQTHGKKRISYYYDSDGECFEEKSRSKLFWIYDLQWAITTTDRAIRWSLTASEWLTTSSSTTDSTENSKSS